MNSSGGSTSSEGLTRPRRRGAFGVDVELDVQVDGPPQPPRMQVDFHAWRSEYVSTKLTLVMDVKSVRHRMVLELDEPSRRNAAIGHQLAPETVPCSVMTHSEPLCECAREIEAVKAHRGKGTSGIRATQYHLDSWRRRRTTRVGGPGFES